MTGQKELTTDPGIGENEQPGESGIMAKIIGTMRKPLAQIQKTKAPANTTMGGNPLVLPGDPAEEFLTGEDWVNIGAELSLSARELEVAVLLFEGKTRASTARRFRRSPGTVRVYIDGLFKKFCVRDRRGLMLRIVRVHWAINCKPH